MAQPESSPSAPPKRLPLASLDPDAAHAGPAFVEGVVTLQWPYSQSNASLSLLICEEDARRRSFRGQLRVEFKGPAARAVDQENVLSGESVVLSLDGAELDQLRDASERDVPWSVRFRRKLDMKVKRGTDWTRIAVDEPESSPSPPPLPLVETDALRLPLEKPPSPRLATPSPPPDTYIFSQRNSLQWATPGILSKRSADFFEAASPFKLRHLFEEDEGGFDLERPRKRPRFSSSFRLVERSPSPGPPVDQDDTSTKDEDEVMQEATAEVRAGREDRDTLNEVEEKAKMEEPTELEEREYEEDEEFQEEEDEESGIPEDEEDEEWREEEGVDEEEVDEEYEEHEIEEEEMAATEEAHNMERATSIALAGELPEEFSAGLGEDGEGKPSQISMPPPPVPSIFMQPGDESSGNAPPASPSLRPVPSPGLPLVSPFLFQGLSSGDYMAAGKEMDRGLLMGSGIMGENDDEEDPVQSFFDMMTGSGSTTIPDEPEITFEELNGSSVDTRTHLDVPKGGPSPRPSVRHDEERPASDGESEKDSLFDEMSDNEVSRMRVRSKSPVPGPSPLRKEVTRPPPATSPPPKRPKGLILQPQSSPSKDATQTPRLQSTETPFLYLPTPSPKITTDGTHFPFSAPPKVDEEGEARTNGIFSSLKRKLFGDRRESAPSDLSAYFGGPARTVAGLESYDKLPEAVVATDTHVPTEHHGTDYATIDSHINLRNGHNKVPPASLKRFDSGTTTSLSEFPSLSELQWGTSVDMIGIVVHHTAIQRAEKGRRDYYMSMRILDSSLPDGISMNLFRPFRNALPKVTAGDVVLLRSFKISTRKHKLYGQSTENSAWAVWTDMGRARPPAMAGPPVEFGDEEEVYVSAIGEWYGGLDEDTRRVLEGPPAEVASVTKPKPKPKLKEAKGKEKESEPELEMAKE